MTRSRRWPRPPSERERAEPGSHGGWLTDGQGQGYAQAVRGRRGGLGYARCAVRCPKL